MTATGFTGMLVNLYPAPTYDTAFQVQYSCIPVGDIGDLELNLSDECRDAIVACAMADIMALPGQGQNLQMAESTRVTYEQLKSKLAFCGVVGEGGSATWRNRNFGSRSNRFSPYQFQNYSGGF